MLKALLARLRGEGNEAERLPEGTLRIEHESRQTQPLGERTVAYSAVEAFAVVDPLARRYDPGARLAMITAGEGVGEDGTSTYWFFGYDFPLQRAQGYFEVQAAEGSDPDAEPRPYELVEVVWPFPRHSAAGMGERWVAEQWRKELDRRPPLPLPFRDSIAAMPELVRASGGRLANTGNPNLRTAWDGRGMPVWRSGTREREFDTSFGRE